MFRVDVADGADGHARNLQEVFEKSREPRLPHANQADAQRVVRVDRDRTRRPSAEDAFRPRAPAVTPKKVRLGTLVIVRSPTGTIRP